jgi:hypothetical protein
MHAMYTIRVASQVHLMKEKELTLVTFEWLLFQMESTRVSGETPVIIIPLTRNSI